MLKQKVKACIGCLKMQMKTLSIDLQRPWAWQHIFALNTIYLCYLATCILNLVSLALIIAKICRQYKSHFLFRVIIEENIFIGFSRNIH